MNMLDLISTGRNTQLHSFPALNTRFTYNHYADDPTDFQVFQGLNLFLEINKKSGFELLRSYSKNGADIIQRIKKRSMENLVCGATSKTDRWEIALGLANGGIHFFSINSGDFLTTKYKSATFGNSVVFLDYGNADESLASLYENGDISIFSLKTGVKMDTFKLDESSSILRFHPTKRSNLAIASYNGSITIWDANRKRKLFFSKSAHTAPCKDISICLTMPEKIVSVGYDCYLNIYDIRGRDLLTKVHSTHPLSTVCLSPCGIYTSIGNLKGDVITYDLRNVNTALATRRVHEGGVVRVAFLPSNVENVSLNNISYASNCYHTTKLKSRQSIDPINEPSLIDFLSPNGYQVRRSSIIMRKESLGFDYVPTNYNDAEPGTQNISELRNSLDLNSRGYSYVSRRNSLGSDNLPTYYSESVSETQNTSELRNSMDRFSKGSLKGLNFSESRMKRDSRGLFSVQPILDAVSEHELDSTDNSVNTHNNYDKSKRQRRKAIGIEERCKLNDGLDLNSIKEDIEMVGVNKNTADKRKLGISKRVTINNEVFDNPTDQRDQKGFSKSISDKNSSTPNSNIRISFIPNSKEDNAMSHAFSTHDSKSIENFISDRFVQLELNVTKKMSEVVEKNEENMKRILEAVQKSEENITKKIMLAENELKFLQDKSFHSSFTYAFNLWKTEEKELDAIKDSLNLLLRIDPFAQDYLNLKAENEALRKTLEEK